MKLQLRRHESNKVPGISTFHLSVRLELNSKELDIVNSSNLLREVIVVQNKESMDGGIFQKLFALKENKRMTLSALIEGYEFQCAQLNEIVELEESIKEGLIGVQRYIDEAEVFGEEELVDIRKLTDEKNR